MENGSALVHWPEHRWHAHRSCGEGAARSRDLRRCHDRYEHAVPPTANLGIRGEFSLSADNRLCRVADLFRVLHAAARSTAQERLGRVAHCIILPGCAAYVPATDPGWRLPVVAFGNVPALRSLYRACHQIPPLTSAVLCDRPRADGCDYCACLCDDITLPLTPAPVLLLCPRLTPRGSF